MLDTEDGLNWATLCKRDVVYAAPKAELTHHRGIVCQERRRIIAEKVIAGLGLAGV